MSEAPWSTTLWLCSLSIILSRLSATAGGVAGREDPFRAGDLILLPIALAALWTLAYQIVLLTRLPALSIVWFFLGFAALAYGWVIVYWKRHHVVLLWDYSFQPVHLLVLALALSCGVVVLFVLEPNQDDIVYFHRALTQLRALSQPILTRQTSVDIDAASFSPVHLATSHEMLMAFLAHFLRIDPLYFYQVIGHVASAAAMPFVFYWCLRCLGLRRWGSASGVVCIIAFLLIDSGGGASYGNTAFGRMWQGKAVVWVLFLPIALTLSYRFLTKGSRSDIVWLTLLAISGVGLSNSALYLIPATVGCSGLAMLFLRIWRRHRETTPLRQDFYRCALLIVPVIYPIGILLALRLNIIPKPINMQGFGPALMPWRGAIDEVVRFPRDLARTLIILLVLPALLFSSERGRFFLAYFLAVCLLCLNPLLSHFWMSNITAACYFRLVYLLPVPLLCGFLPEIAGRLLKPAEYQWHQRLASAAAISILFVACARDYQVLTIQPRNTRLHWKSPSDYQILPSNLQFAQAAGPYIAHGKLLAPEWTASCELPLLFPEMKPVAPRLVLHYFLNAGNNEEGALRRMAQAFVEGEKTNDPRRAAALAASLRVVIQSGRANAVAAPESESARVLTALRLVDPGWHEVVHAGGLVLMLPTSTTTRAPIGDVEALLVASCKKVCVPPWSFAQGGRRERCKLAPADLLNLHAAVA